MPTSVVGTHGTVVMTSVVAPALQVGMPDSSPHAEVSDTGDGGAGGLIVVCMPRPEFHVHLPELIAKLRNVFNLVSAPLYKAISPEEVASGRKFCRSVVRALNSRGTLLLDRELMFVCRFVMCSLNLSEMGKLSAPKFSFLAICSNTFLSLNQYEKHTNLIREGANSKSRRIEQ